MDSDPRVDRVPVGPSPGHIPLDRSQRVALLPRRSDRGDQVSVAVGPCHAPASPPLPRWPDPFPARTVRSRPPSRTRCSSRGLRDDPRRRTGGPRRSPTQGARRRRPTPAARYAAPPRSPRTPDRQPPPGTVAAHRTADPTAGSPRHRAGCTPATRPQTRSQPRPGPAAPRTCRPRLAQHQDDAASPRLASHRVQGRPDVPLWGALVSRG